MSFWFSRSSAHSPRRRPPPQLEVLEDRVVPVVTSGPLPVSQSSNADTDPATAIAGEPGQSMALVAWTQETGDGHTDIVASLGRPPATVGGTFTVAGTDADEEQAAVAVSRNGSFVVAWVHREDGNSDVRYALYRGDQTTPFFTGSVAASSLQEVEPQVAMDRRGNFVVAYTVLDEPATNGRGQTVLTRNVRAKVFDANGVENAVLRAAVKTDRDEFAPRIDINDDRRVSISYLESDPNAPTSRQSLRLRLYRLSADGTNASDRGRQQIAGTSGNERIIDHDVDVAANGNTLVVFNLQREPGTQVIQGRRVAASGARGGRFTLETVAFELGTSLSVAQNPNNLNFALAFQSDSGGERHAVVQEFARKGDALFEVGGVPVAFRLDSAEGEDVATSNASISIDDNNNYFVAYEADVNAGDIEAQYGTLPE